MAKSAAEVALRVSAEDDDNEEGDDDDDDDDEDEDGDEIMTRAADFGISSDLLEREKKFRELNKQIKSKTAHVIQEAEKVVNEGLSILTTDIRRKPASANEINSGERPHTSAEISGLGSTRPGSLLAAKAPATPRGERPQSAFARSESAPKDDNRPGTRFADEEVTEDLAVKIALSEPPRIPGMTEGMGSEATERFLRAKALALTDELDKTMAELKEKDLAALKASEQAKVAKEELAQLSKLHSVLQKDCDKAARQIEELTKKNEALEAELSAMRKEIDKLSRNRKQAEAETSSSKLRLNRALEEADRCKQLSVRAQQEAKAAAEAGRIKAEKWANECKRLEKQKQELMLAFKKQGQLVDVLKRQKSHAEAAKLLEITEAEFVKTLDWKV